MDNLLNMISSVNDEKSHNDNMYVNNIIVKKNDPTKNLKKDSLKNYKTDFVLPRKDLSGKILRTPTFFSKFKKNEKLTDLWLSDS